MSLIVVEKHVRKAARARTTRTTRIFMPAGRMQGRAAPGPGPKSESFGPGCVCVVVGGVPSDSAGAPGPRRRRGCPAVPAVRVPLWAVSVPASNACWCAR